MPIERSPDRVRLESARRVGVAAASNLEGECQRIGRNWSGDVKRAAIRPCSLEPIGLLMPCRIDDRGRTTHRATTP